MYDHTGLFEGYSSADYLSFDIPEVLDLVLIILKHGCSFNMKEREILSLVVNKWKISKISALVLTHCEGLSEEEREEMIEQFKKDHKSIAELMGKKILAVGFPGNSHIPQFSQRVKHDKEKLKDLVYSCNEGVNIRSCDTNVDEMEFINIPSLS